MPQTSLEYPIQIAKLNQNPNCWEFRINRIIGYIKLVNLQFSIENTLADMSISEYVSWFLFF